MTKRIHENLSRQYKALKVLQSLQLEEFSHLMGFRAQSVHVVELSIKDLMGQISGERSDMRLMLKSLNPAASALSDIAEIFGQGWEQVRDLLENIDNLDKDCAKLAEKSHILAQSLYDLSSGYVNHFKQKLSPCKQTYGRGGVFSRSRSTPAMLRGTL
jgi:hypothetical protein